MAEDKYRDISWLSEEARNSLCNIDRIGDEQDVDGLFRLTDNADFSLALAALINKKCDYNPEVLNHTQRVLFLCIHLENAGQADSILGFLQEDYPKWGHDAVNALREIGAVKSADIIEQAIKLLPADGSWFFKTSNKESEKLMGKLDGDFGRYPDGSMRDLYRAYAEMHREDF